MSESPPKRKSPISLGEAIALAALTISAAGLWLAWQDTSKDGPTRIVEQRQPIPLALRGIVRDDGRALEISPVETGHGLQSLTVNVPTSGAVIEVGSDGILSAKAVESALNVDDSGKGPHQLKATIAAAYVEGGVDRKASRSYTIRYRWQGGGLFDGRSLRFTGFGR